MSVRYGTVGDVPRLVRIFLQFYASDGRPVKDAVPLAAFCLEHMNAPDKICLVAGEPIGAFIAGVVQPHYHTGIVTAFKTVWLSAPGKSGHGAKLIRPFEEWAREKGAKRIIFSGREKRTLKLLELKGYEPLEVAYDKELH
ncbi:MAG: hypothetical protein ACLP7P_08595 [Rhodomicrobium sp.]